MATYQLVDKHDVQHHNRYYEVRMNNGTSAGDGPHPYSLFFTTDEENLEDVAAEIMREQAPDVDNYVIIPHRKDE